MCEREREREREREITDLVNGDSVDIGVIDKPNDLVREELSIVLGGEVGLSGLTGVELQGLPDPLSQDIESWVGLHDLGHCLLHQRFHPWYPVPKHTGREIDTGKVSQVPKCLYL